MITDWASASLRVAASAWGNIDGEDEGLRIPSQTVPTADPERRGGSRVDLGVGFNAREPFFRQRLAVEAVLPGYQNLDGPQLGVAWILTVGIQINF